MEELRLYAVRNKDGKWFASKRSGGTWSENFSQARIYKKISPARSIVTYFANKFPHVMPDLVILHIDTVELVDESERVAASQRREQTQMERRELRRRKEELRRAKDEFERAQRRLTAIQEKSE
jgi:acyl-CoA reductase-like NAD-dependent aldehyde dehydrogenase